jgi:hypothetical protein
MVARIETLLAALHMYFSKSPKLHLELQKLVELLESKGRKILQNVKMRWISILSPLKRVLSKYRTFLVKMYSDHLVKPTISAAKVNYELMADIKCLLTLAAARGGHIPLCFVTTCDNGVFSGGVFMHLSIFFPALFVNIKLL